MLSGCSLNVNDLIDNINIDVDGGSDDDGDSHDGDTDGDDIDGDDIGIDVTNPDGLGGDGKGPDEDALVGIAQYDISNNGNFFVQIQERVYFRVYGPTAHEEGVLWGRFMDVPTGGESEICYFDRTTGEVVDAFKDYGFGKIVFCDSAFYMNGYNSLGETIVYAVDSVGNIVRDEVCSGSIIDFSEDCAITIVSKNEDDFTRFTGIDEKGKEAFNFKTSNGSYAQYLGCFQEYFVYAEADYSSETLRLYSYNMSDSHGKPVFLGQVTMDMGRDSFDYVEGFEADWVRFSFGGEVYIGVSYNSGTGHMFDGGFILAGEAWDENSLKVVEPIYASDFYDMPYIEFTESGYTLQQEEPFTYGIRYYDTGYAGLVYHEYNGREITINEFMFDDYSFDTAYSTLVLAEGPKPSSDVYIMRATQIRDEAASIGWRDAFRCLKMEYLRYNYYNGEVEVLATIEY